MASDDTQRHSRNFNTFKSGLNSANVKSARFVKLEQAVKSSSHSRVFRFNNSTKTSLLSQLLQFFRTSVRKQEFDLVINMKAFDVRRDEIRLQSRVLCQEKYESQASRKNMHTFLS